MFDDFGQYSEKAHWRKNLLALFLNISRRYYYWVLSNLNFGYLSDLHSLMSCGYLRIFDNQNIVKGLFKLYNVVIIYMSAPDTSLVITSQAATWDTCRHAQSRVEMLAVATRQLQDILQIVTSFVSVLVHLSWYLSWYLFLCWASW